MSLEKTASTEQLVNSIKRHSESLAELLSDPKKFEDNLLRDKITAKGGSIAVVAHALTKHEQIPENVDAPAIQSAAVKVSSAEDYMTAKSGLSAIQKSLDSSETTALDPEVGWYEVADMTNMMEEANYLYQGLRRTVRRSRDPEADALDAVTVALIAYPLKANEDFAFDDEDLAEWQKYATQMHDDFLAIAKAIREKDTDTARDLYKTATRSCASCHKKFREE